jgi:hypothetical protein
MTNNPYTYVCILSENIKYICKSFGNSKKNKPLASFSGLFCSKDKYILPSLYINQVIEKLYFGQWLVVYNNKIIQSL